MQKLWCRGNYFDESRKTLSSRKVAGENCHQKKVKTFFYSCCGQLVLGLASGLEAFSREPPCDSIGALAARQTPETSGMAWEFLSYYPKLPSRCLRDPLRYLVNSWRKTRKKTKKSVKLFFRKRAGQTHQVRKP